MLKNKKALKIAIAVGILIVAAVASIGIVYYYNGPFWKKAVIPQYEGDAVQQDAVLTPKQENAFKKLNIKRPDEYAEILIPSHSYQTFNNCGPASTSMLLSYYGINKSQKEVGDILRPYQIASGDNDDKSVTLQEIADYAESLGFVAYHRPGGNLGLLKLLLANDIPVLTRTYLHDYDDIGHYRIVRGFNDRTQQLLQDDSFQGPNKFYSYDNFLTLWQPFNFEYLVIVPKEQSDIVEEILGENADETVAWRNALKMAEAGSDDFSLFNQAIAHYYLGNYQQTIDLFERSIGGLPSRTLWYQIEPILAYQKVGDYDTALAIISNILDNGNRAFAELYQIRGEIYLDQGDKELAKKEFETALQYKYNFTPAKEALDKIN